MFWKKLMFWHRKANKIPPAQDEDIFTQGRGVYIIHDNDKSNQGLAAMALIDKCRAETKTRTAIRYWPGHGVVLVLGSKEERAAVRKWLAAHLPITGESVLDDEDRPRPVEFTD